MNVRELIEELQRFDGDAEVYLMEQPSWPFEYAIAGVVERIEFERDEDEISDGEKKPNDVFILEGSQLRYGSKDAWGW